MVRGVLLELMAFLAFFSLRAEAQSHEPPRLSIEASAEFATVRERLDSLDPKRFMDILGLVGLTAAGPAIHVVLASDQSDWAQGISPWIAGFARGASDEVVIFPARTPGYPHHSLEDVLRHEIAHVLIARAAGSHPVPRWFNEGVALAAERAWGFEDQTRVLYQLVLGKRTSLNEIDRLFSGDRRDQQRAYALSGAFTRYLFQHYGSAAPAKVLSQVRGGTPFERAFADVTGVTLGDIESGFWESQRIWTTWVPVITSSATVWMVITLIAVLAIRRRRQKDAEISRKWDEEESIRGDQ
jgi:hypothetical protein